MARTKTETLNHGVLVTDADTPNLPALAEASSERHHQLMELDAKYGDGLPYERERVINVFHVHIGNASNSLIEAGKCVILIREHEARGDFDRLVEERLGMSRRSAYKFMGATRRLLEMSPQTVQTFARIGKSKLLDLMVDADDEDLEELANGGTFAGMALDDVECMSARELKAALREARENEQAMGRVLQEKNAKLDKLATEKVKPAAVTDMWNAQILGATDEISQVGTVGDEVLGKHIQFIDLCEAIADPLDPDQPDYRAKLEQARVPISRLKAQLDRYAHLVARLRFEFDTRVGGYLDESHILTPEDTE